jgi:hypothetical protein
VIDSRAFALRNRLACVIAVSALAIGGRARAQNPPAPPPDCTAPEHRQFDFWLGDWAVTDSTGQRRLGDSRISSILKNCVLLEEWTGAGGSSGKSYNIYSRADGKWHQSWVSDTGNLLLLEGGLRNGAMVLQGETPSPTGGTTLQRITWSVVDSDRDHVRQMWELSTDGGATWNVAFDGHYRRKR